jgi:hypothetical protein
MRVVEGQIEVERVARHLFAQRVGGHPGNVRSGVRNADREHLLRQRDGEKSTGDKGQHRHASSEHRKVDEHAQQLRTGNRQRRGDEQQQAKTRQLFRPAARQHDDQALTRRPWSVLRSKVCDDHVSSVQPRSNGVHDA